MNDLRKHLTDAIVITGIILVTASLSLASFARKAITYNDLNGLIDGSVTKKEYSVASLTSGTVSSVKAVVGQHVKKGDVLLTLSNEVLIKQIALLEAFGKDNLSAQTQLSGLKVEQEALTIYAPTDGVLSEIGSEGHYVNKQDIAARVYADTDVKLLAYIDQSDYVVLQKRTNALTAHDKRLSADLPISFSGIKQKIEEEGATKDKVGVYFTFSNQSDTINLLQNEKLQIKLIDDELNTNKPIDRFIRFYKRFAN